MFDKIKPFIDSGKKLKIRGDKLLALLISAGFEGTVMISGFGDEKIVLADNSIFSEKKPEQLDLNSEKVKFTLFSDKFVTGEKWVPYQFLYNFINSLSKDFFNQIFAPMKDDFLTIKPESLLFPFLSVDLAEYHGKKKISVLSAQKHAPLFYFLLLTEYAAVIKVQKKEVVEIPAEEEDPLLKLVAFITEKEHAKSMWELLDVKPETAETALQRNYMHIVKILHPDRLMQVDSSIRDLATGVLAAASSAYSLLKDVEIRDRLITLEKKFGIIKTKEAFERFDEIDALASKADFAMKLKEFEAAYHIFETLYKETNLNFLLEKMVLSLKNVKMDKNEKNKKLLEYIEKIHKAHVVTVNVLYVEAEINESVGNTAKEKEILQKILKFYPGEIHAQSMLKKLEYYEKLAKK